MSGILFLNLNEKTEAFFRQLHARGLMGPEGCNLEPLKKSDLLGVNLDARYYSGENLLTWALTGPKLWSDVIFLIENLPESELSDPRVPGYSLFSMLNGLGAPKVVVNALQERIPGVSPAASASGGPSNSMPFSEERMRAGGSVRASYIDPYPGIPGPG